MQISNNNTDPIKIYDARWEVDEFDDSSIIRLFEATFLYAFDQGIDSIVFTRDGRLFSGHVLELGLRTAQRAGLKVYACIDPISTPAGYFLGALISSDHSETMTLVITASHNPKNYVGIKFTVSEVRAIGLDCGPDGGLRSIRDLFHSRKKMPESEQRELSIINPVNQYITEAMRLAKIKPGDLTGLHVVMDAMGGSAGPEVYQALLKAGVSVTARGMIPDGTFPCGAPNPTSTGKMKEALRLAAQNPKSIVIGMDGDGDRLVFGDKDGLLNAAFSAVPILNECLQLFPLSAKKIVYDPKTAPPALSEWKKMGAEPKLFRNGHSQIKEYMQEIHAVMAVEESGHFYHTLDVMGVNVSMEFSVLTILLFLKFCKKTSSALHELQRLQLSFYTSGEVNYKFTSDDVRDTALNDIVNFFVEDGALSADKTETGADLGGFQLVKGSIYTNMDAEGECSDIVSNTSVDEWYILFVRNSTNEKSVLRLFHNAQNAGVGRIVERNIENICKKMYNGVVVE